MSRVRFEFAGRLVTLTPLHVGSGEVRAVEAVKRSDRAKETPEVAAIVRDALKRPYLPGTAIKGLLRRLAKEIPDLDGIDRDELFGVIKSAPEGGSVLDEAANGKMGQMGALLCRGAEQVGSPPDAREAPFADQEPTAGDAGELGAGIFIAARTGIDPATGTAKDSILFFQEMVAPRTAFTFRCAIDLRGPEAVERGERLAAVLIRVLDRLTAENGAAIGKGQADGFGHVRLDPDLTIGRYILDNTGEFAASDATELWRKRTKSTAATCGRILNLHCDDPFIIIDSSRKTERGARASPGETPQIKAQRLGATLPLVLGSSISGVLRSRARWLAALTAHQYGDAKPTDGGRIIRRLDEIDSLTSVQRLFGVTGFRGLLEIDAVLVHEAEPWSVTSVKLDRFSGAPIDNALFTTETFVGVRLALQLRLASRRETVPREADKKLFDALLCDIKRNGIQLGHGGNKGFGWFSVEEAAHA